MTDHEIKKCKRLLDGPDAVRAGGALAGIGLLAVAAWPYLLAALAFPSGEDVYSRCLMLVDGKLTNINLSTFPVQIFCETEGNRAAGSIYTAWESLGMSSVLAFVVLSGFYGLWMMVRRDRRLDGRT